MLSQRRHDCESSYADGTILFVGAAVYKLQMPHEGDIPTIVHIKFMRILIRFVCERTRSQLRVALRYSKASLLISAFTRRRVEKLEDGWRGSNDEWG
jgi:hypothetical protein